GTGRVDPADPAVAAAERYRVAGAAGQHHGAALRGIQADLADLPVRADPGEFAAPGQAGPHRTVGGHGHAVGARSDVVFGHGHCVLLIGMAASWDGRLMGWPRPLTRGQSPACTPFTAAPTPRAAEPRRCDMGVAPWE